VTTEAPSGHADYKGDYGKVRLYQHAFSLGREIATVLPLQPSAFQSWLTVQSTHVLAPADPA